MAKTLSFYRINSSNTPSVYQDGAVYFDEVNHLLLVGNGDSKDPDVFSGVRSVSYSNKVLTFINEAGTEVTVDLNGLQNALTDAINTAINAVWDVVGKTTSDGLRKKISDAEGDIDALETAVGDANSGLVHDVAGHETRISTLESNTSSYLTEVPVEGIKSGESIISLDGKNLTSTLKISYDSANNQIKLLGINDAQIGDAVDCSNFIKDGILESAEIVTIADGKEGTEDSTLADGKYFKFTWNTEPATDPTYISLAEFAVETYSAGADLKLEDNVFSVALDEDIEISGVKVGNLGVDITKLDAGMTLSEILTAMLCKDIDVKVNAVPSLSNISGISVTEYEVGSTVPALTLSTTFNDGSFVSSDTSLYPASKFKDSDHNGSSPLAAGCAVGEYFWTGTNASTTNTATVDSFEITANTTFKVHAAYGASSATPKTLLKNNSSVAIAAGNTPDKSITISAYYKDFYGEIPSTVSVTTGGLQSVEGITLSGGKHTAGEKEVSASAGSKGIYVFTKNTVTKVTNKAKTADFTSGLKLVSKTYTNGTTETAYNLYSLVFPDGLESLNEYIITLS